jgi:putative transposase
MRLLAFCVMNNHWHLVLWPDESVSLSAFMHWLTSTHVRRYHRHYELTGTGHLYQDRYRNRICLDERGVLAVIRYVESNPLSASLVRRAEDWTWSSLRVRLDGDEDRLLSDGPVAIPPDWTQIVNETKPQDRVAALEACRPVGKPETRGRKKRPARIL